MAPKRARISTSSTLVNTFPTAHPRLTRAIYGARAADKEMLLERAFNLNELRRYIPDYVDTLEEWGWTNVVCLKKYVMPEVVKHFYFFGEDKEYDSSGNALGQRDLLEMPTKLLNEKFIVSVDMVNDVCGITERGGARALPKLNALEKKKCLKIVFKKEEIEEFPAELAKVSNLDVPERILHYVLAQSVFARKRASEMTDLDLFCMAKIMKEEPFNFGAFVIGKMLEGCVKVRSTKGFSCPFGKIITLICEAKFGVGRLENYAQVTDPHGDSIEENLKLMSFVFRLNKWISPGYRDLDSAIAKFLRDGSRKKRRSWARSKDLPNMHFGDHGEQGEESEEENEEGNEEEEEEEDENENDIHEDLKMIIEQNNEILKGLKFAHDREGLRLEREREWKIEDMRWKAQMMEMMKKNHGGEGSSGGPMP